MTDEERKETGEAKVLNVHVEGTAGNEKQDSGGVS